ncbi:MAG: fatty acid hydroxylase, partial [Pseudomonadota bacterium]
MLLSFVITAILLSALIAARYFLVAGFFHWLVWSNGGRSDWARRLARRKPSPKMMQHERNWSLVASGIYGVAGAIVFVAWEAGGTALYTNLTAADIWYIPLSIGLCLFIHDTWFYWTHRVMHHPRL